MRPHDYSIEGFVRSPLDDEEVHGFVTGDCHFLAAAAHRRTEWPIFCVTDANHADDEPDCVPVLHAVVRMPDGRYLDARGIFTEEALNEISNRIFTFPVVVRSTTADQIDRIVARRQSPLFGIPPVPHDFDRTDAAAERLIEFARSASVERNFIVARL